MKYGKNLVNVYLDYAKNLIRLKYDLGDEKRDEKMYFYMDNISK